MFKDLRQIIPSSFCLQCDVCCRYAEDISVYVPYFFPKEKKTAAEIGGDFSIIGKVPDSKPLALPAKDCYVCQFFVPEKNACQIYNLRPFDCRLYPFMVTYDKHYNSVILALDTKCPYLIDKIDSKELSNYADYLADMLEDRDMVEEINANKNFINDFQEDFITIKRLKNLSEKVCFSSLGLTRISLKDKELFDRYFAGLKTELSAFSFASIYIWSSVLNILWVEVGGALCIFAGNEKDYFLLLPPLRGGLDRYAVETSLEMLPYMNASAFRPRIENIPQEFIGELSPYGLKSKAFCREYIYNQKDLAELKGKRFKTKRKFAQDFLKNYKYRYRELEEKDTFGCLKLYIEWARQRLEKNKDDYFRFLIEDSYFAQKTALFNLKSLGLKGQVVEDQENKISAYTLGFPLNKETFAILFETTDLTKKGLSQFIFRQFSHELHDYKYINTLSDSGLENLKKVKLSYHPLKTPLVFTASF